MYVSGIYTFQILFSYVIEDTQQEIKVSHPISNIALSNRLVLLSLCARFVSSYAQIQKPRFICFGQLVDLRRSDTDTANHACYIPYTIPFMASFRILT